MATKTYSNGAENLDADFLMISGTQVGAGLRLDDGFYNFEAGAIDAPEWMTAGATGLCRPPESVTGIQPQGL